MRLITRSDFDGLVCAAILRELDIIGSTCLVHPKDVQDNKIDVGKNDVIANLPYVEGCGLWFDHHISENTRLTSNVVVKGSYELLPSAARVVFNYYRSRLLTMKACQRIEELVGIADKVDTASFSEEDILDPQGWIMLAFITDPRSNFGKNRSFGISNLKLMQGLPDLLLSQNVDEILAMPDFKERVIAYKNNVEKFNKVLLNNSTIEGKALVIDFRGKKDMPIGNRFIEYVLYPKQNISIRLVDGKKSNFVMISVGHSIVNRSSNVNVGNLMLRYAGGGHRHAGTCQVSNGEVNEILREILEVINKKEPQSKTIPPEKHTETTTVLNSQ